MDMDDLLPTGKKPAQKNLEELSIEALNDYIAELETEIVRVKDAIKVKEAARLGAESFFKS